MNQYNQYIYRNGEWLLIGDGSISYALSKNGNNLILTGSNGATSTVPLNDLIVRWVPNTAYSQGDTVFYNGRIYQANQNLNPSQTFGTVTHSDLVYSNFSVGDETSEVDKGILDGSSFMEKITGEDYGRSLLQYFYDETNQSYNYDTKWLVKGDLYDENNNDSYTGVYTWLDSCYEYEDYLSFSIGIEAFDSFGEYHRWLFEYENNNGTISHWFQDPIEGWLNADEIQTYNFYKIINISTWGPILEVDNELATALGLSIQHKHSITVIGDWSDILEIPNATSTNVGGVKMRLDSLTNTLYLTNDGSNA